MTNSAKYIASVIKYALTAGFATAGTDETNIGQEFYLLHKQEGAVFYVISLVDAAIEEQTRQYLDKTIRWVYAINEKYLCRHIVIFNVIILSQPQEWVASFISTSEEYWGQELYQINYAVSLQEQKLYFSDIQPHDLAGLYTILQTALDTPATEIYDSPPQAVAGIMKEAAQKSTLPIKQRNAYATYIIIFVNALLLNIMELDGGSQNTLILLKYGAMNFDLFLQGDYYRVLTASFLHIGILHFVYNSLSLYIFGGRIEKHYGTLPFIAVYLLSSVAGNLANSIFVSGVLAGASSGIFGLIGSALAITQFGFSDTVGSPEETLKRNTTPFLTRKTLDGLSFYMILLFIVSGIFWGFMQPDIGNIAHIAGLITGYLVSIAYLKISYK